MANDQPYHQLAEASSENTASYALLNPLIEHPDEITGLLDFLEKQSHYVENLWYGHGDKLREATATVQLDQESCVFNLIIHFPTAQFDVTQDMHDSLIRNAYRHFATSAKYRKLLETFAPGDAVICFINSET